MVYLRTDAPRLKLRTCNLCVFLLLYAGGLQMAAAATLSPSAAAIWDYMLAPTPRLRLQPGRMTAQPYSFTDREVDSLMEELSAQPFAQQARDEGRRFRQQEAQNFLQALKNSQVPQVPLDLAAIDRFAADFETFLQALRRREEQQLRPRAEQFALRQVGLPSFAALNLTQNHDLLWQWRGRTQIEFLRLQNLESHGDVKPSEFLDWRQAQLRQLQRSLVQTVHVLLHLRLEQFDETLFLYPVHPGEVLPSDVRNRRDLPKLTAEALDQMELIEQPLPNSVPPDPSGMAPTVATWLLRSHDNLYFAMIEPHAVTIRNTTSGQIVTLANNVSDFHRGTFLDLHPPEFSRVPMEWALFVGSHLVQNLRNLIDLLEKLPPPPRVSELMMQVQKTLAQIRASTPSAAAMSDSARSDDARLASWIGLLTDWRWWGWSLQPDYWQKREAEALQARRPLLMWKGSKQSEFATTPENRVPSLVAQKMSNGQPVPGYAFSLITSLAGPPVPRQFLFASANIAATPIFPEAESVDYVVQSLLVSDVVNGRFPLPTPLDSVPVFLQVSGEPAVQILRTSQGYLGQVPSRVREVTFRVGFHQMAAARDVELPALSTAGLLRLAEKLRGSSLHALSAALEQRLGLATTARDLAQGIRNTSLYSFVPTQEREASYFDRFQPFLNENNVLCFQCDGAAHLLWECLREVWAGDPDWEAHILTVMIRSGDKLLLQTHAVVDVRYRGQRVALLDGTPWRVDPRTAHVKSALLQATAPEVSTLSANEWLVRQLQQVRQARQELSRQVEATASRRLQFEPDSVLIRLNQMAAVFAEWEENKINLPELLTRVGAQDLEALSLRLGGLRREVDLWRQNIPGRLPPRLVDQVRFLRSLNAEMTELASTMERAVRTAQKQECEFVLGAKN